MEAHSEIHSIEYEGIEIEYQLIRKDVKYINLRVNKYSQVVVSAAKRVPFSVIEEFVQSKALWIITHLAEVEKLRHSQPSGMLQDGKTVYYLGKPLILTLAQGSPQITRTETTLHMVTRQIQPQELRSEYLAWLRQEAETVFPKILEQVYPLVKTLSVPYPTIQIRNMRSIWGSCTVEGASIRLNLQLMKTAPECIEQVVLHELLHFCQPDHSKKFYRLMEERMPDWKARKERLETEFKDGI